MVDTAQITRYEQVKQILDRAAAGGAVDYDGKGQFWNLPLPQLLEVEVYGIRMIAPVIAATTSLLSCRGRRRLQRGQRRSGLIRGLRGQAPFDGTQYPPLPWGGRPFRKKRSASSQTGSMMVVPPAIIRSHSTPKGRRRRPRSRRLDPSNVEAAARSFEVYEGSPNEYSYKYGELKQRTNLDCMSESQVEKLRWAFRELYRFNKWPEDRRSYNNMALIHQNHCQHGWERFLPWHRVYLYEMEQALQDVCPGVTIPYWDFTMPQYCPEHPEKGSIIPPAYKAYLTKESINYLVKHAKPALPAKAGATLLKQMVEPGLRYPSQSTFFAAVAEMTSKEFTEGLYRERFIDALLAANSLWYPLRYPAEFHGGGKINQVIHYHYPTAEDMDQILRCGTFETSAAVASTMIPTASSIRIPTTRCTSGLVARTPLQTMRRPPLPQRSQETATVRCASPAGASTRWPISTASPHPATCSVI